MDIFDLALAHTPRVGGRTAAHLIECCFSAENIFSLSYDQLRQATQLNDLVAKAIVDRVGFAAAEREWIYCQQNNITPIAAVDAQYPPLLREIADHPHILYAQGDISILTHNIVSIVGTRRMTSYGDRAVMALVEQLAGRVHNLVIASGLALGIDGAAHRAALECGVPTVAVLPNSLPNVTPASHASLGRAILDSGGALISEVPSSTSSAGKGYISRNRIISALAEATIVAESAAKGGAMATAAIALSQSRFVGAVPGRIFDSASKGCNDLISRREAVAITSADDLIRELGWSDRISDGRERCEFDPSRLAPLSGSVDQEGRVVAQLNGSQRELLSLFVEDDKIHISTIERRSGRVITELVASLMELELLGAIRSLPGSLYERLIPYSDLGVTDEFKSDIK